MKYPQYEDWSKPWISKAKKRGCKLSNKNLMKLRHRWISHIMSTYGLNAAFQAIYANNIKNLIPQGVVFWNKVKKEPIKPIHPFMIPPKK